MKSIALPAILGRSYLRDAPTARLVLLKLEDQSDISCTSTPQLYRERLILREPRRWLTSNPACG